MASNMTPLNFSFLIFFWDLLRRVHVDRFFHYTIVILSLSLSRYNTARASSSYRSRSATIMSSRHNSPSSRARSHSLKSLFSHCRKHSNDNTVIISPVENSTGPSSPFHNKVKRNVDQFDDRYNSYLMKRSVSDNEYISRCDRRKVTTTVGWTGLIQRLDQNGEQCFPFVP